MSHFRAAVRDTENTLGDLNIKYPQRHGDIDRVGTSPSIAQIASRLDELANLVRQRGPEPDIHRETRRPIVERGFHPIDKGGPPGKTLV